MVGILTCLILGDYQANEIGLLADIIITKTCSIQRPINDEWLTNSIGK